MNGSQGPSPFHVSLAGSTPHQRVTPGDHQEGEESEEEEEGGGEWNWREDLRYSGCMYIEYAEDLAN